MNGKERALRDTLSSLGSVIVAYSGGIDSAYLAYVAHSTLGSRATAITADSPRSQTEPGAGAGARQGRAPQARAPASTTASDKTISPGNHYNAKVNGQLCRFDGVHFSAYCSGLLEPRVLGEVRKMLG